MAETRDAQDGSTDQSTILNQPFSWTVLKDEAEIQTKPAKAVADEFDGWEEFASDEDDLESITGVGPATAGALDALKAEVETALQPELETASATDTDEPDVDDTASPSVETDDEPDTTDEDTQTTDADDSASGTAADESSERGDDDDSTHERIEQLEHPETFEVTLPAGILQGFVYAVAVIVDEFRLEVREDSLGITAVDTANVLMGDAELEKSAFNSWNASPGIVGVDASRLWNVLKMAGTSDEISLSFDAETRKMEVKFDGLTFSLGTLTPVSIREPPELPEGLELTTSATMSPGEINRALDAVDMVSDHCEMESDSEDNIITIRGDGDTDTAEYTPEDLSAINPGDDNALYALEYLKNIPRAIKKFKADQQPDELNVKFGDSHPVMVDFEFADEAGSVLYMLAPRIQSS